MNIGIDGSRAFLIQRTGIEEYSYQVIKHLREHLKEDKVVLYLRRGQEVDFSLSKNWEVKHLNLYYFWTQLGLAWEMFWRPTDVLFVPAHTAPFIHPEKTVVVIHGLEYEFVSKAYSWRARIYMRFFIKKSCQWAKKIISVSENTKRDLLRLYNIPENKISVIYEGYDDERASSPADGENLKKKTLSSQYLLFIGRLEERKNVIGIIKAFEILKERYKIPHKLVLAGRFGYGAEEIRVELEKVNCASEIILPGFVSDERKWELLSAASVFLFPTFYEGFGIPILEAQSVGVPVVAGNNSSIPEVVNGSALLVDANNAEQIADATHKLISDEFMRDDIIKKGYDNTKRFSWNKCALMIAEVLRG
jgi:glycosyltransferase involved in cell wall biosynthesis